jgi:hypothetical protein
MEENKENYWFRLVFGILPNVLYLLADVSEHLVGLIIWVEVIRDKLSPITSTQVMELTKWSETLAKKYSTLGNI